jgi:hypothetical protein
MQYQFKMAYIVSSTKFTGVVLVTNAWWIFAREATGQVPAD